MSMTRRSPGTGPDRTAAAESSTFSKPGLTICSILDCYTNS
jgi:hypothetical protein